MTKLVYEVVEHAGGWAYRLGDVYSESFPTRREAHEAADRVAAEQGRDGVDEAISYQDAKGRWHHEVARGDDRPEVEVAD